MKLSPTLSCRVQKLFTYFFYSRDVYPHFVRQWLKANTLFSHKTGKRGWNQQVRRAADFGGIWVRKEGGNSIDFRSVKEMPTRAKRKVGFQHDVAQTALHFLAGSPGDYDDKQ